MFFVNNYIHSLPKNKFHYNIYKQHIYEKSLEYTNNVFQIPRSSLSPDKQISTLNLLRSTNINPNTKYLTLFGFNKPFLFVKKCRINFLSFFFYKKNTKSFTHIIHNFKKHNPQTIGNFFLNTVYNVITLNFFKIRFLTYNLSYRNIIFINNKVLNNLWGSVATGDIIQIIWSNSFFFNYFNSKKKNYLNNRSFFQNKSMINQINYLKCSSLTDYRSNTLFILNSKKPLKSVNYYNWETFSSYNWKIKN